MIRLKFGISYDVGPASTWFEPSWCLDLAVKVEEAGFDALWMGDHLLPWYHTNAHTPQAWIWMASAAERTKEIPVGSAVTVPMFKYHPIVVAHAFATLARIYPGRVLLGVGTGEAINEEAFLERWPSWKERAETLVEALELIKKFWSSQDYFDHIGRYFKVRNLFCYDKPKQEIPIYFSGLGKKAAFLAGQQGYHLMTGGLPDFLRDTIFLEYERGLKSIGKDPSEFEKCVYLDFAYGDIKKCIEKIRRCSGFLLPENFDERDPRRIEATTDRISDETIIEKFTVASNSTEFIDEIERYRKIGSTHIIIGDWGYDPISTIENYATKVAPYFKSSSSNSY